MGKRGLAALQWKGSHMRPSRLLAAATVASTITIGSLTGAVPNPIVVATPAGAHVLTSQSANCYGITAELNGFENDTTPIFVDVDGFDTNGGFLLEGSSGTHTVPWTEAAGEEGGPDVTLGGQISYDIFWHHDGQEVRNGPFVFDADQCVPDDPKVRICHRNQGSPEWVEIEISESALPAHLSHQWGEDIYPVPEGGCPQPPPEECPEGQIGTLPDDCHEPQVDYTSDCVGTDWVISNDASSEAELTLFLTPEPGAAVVIPPGGSYTVSADLDEVYVGDEVLHRPNGCEPEDPDHPEPPANPPTTTPPPVQVTVTADDTA